MIKVFKKILVTLTFFVCALDAFGCELSYQGIVGSGKDAIAVIRDEATSTSQFVKVSERVKNCAFSVSKVGRGKITLIDGRKVLELTPEGFAGAEGEMALAQKQQLDAEADVASAYSVNIDQLNEIGDKLVEEGKLSKEEVAALIAEEQRSYSLAN